MLITRAILFLFTIIFLFDVKLCNAKVSCITCPGTIHINITTDTDLNTDGCQLEDDDLCSLILNIDYTRSNNSFGLLSGTVDPPLILTNGEPQVTELTNIWFTEVRVQRMAQIFCFAGASCGVDLLKQIYRDEFRLFDYEAIQNRLSDMLYSSSAPGSSLICASSSDSSVSCPNGFCRSIFDGNGVVAYSSCVNKGPVPNPYGMTVTKTTLADLGGDHATVIFTCNKPMCNSKESIQQVLQQLIAAQVIPQPTTTTTTTSPTTTPTNPSTAVSTETHSPTTEGPTGAESTPTGAPTGAESTPTGAPTGAESTPTADPTRTDSSTPHNMGIKMLNNEQKFLVFFLLLLPIFKFLN